MFQNIINKLKTKKQQLQTAVNNNTPIEDEKTPFEIILAKEGNFFKMEISDYISIVDYVERMKSIDNLGIYPLICNAVLWNGAKQKVNKGLYYVIPIENRIYNILMGNNQIKIDERIENNGITEEKFMSLNGDYSNYSYTFHKHDKTGNTFYTRYFNKRGFSFGKLDLSIEEFEESVKSLFCNLESIDGMENIVDIEELKEYILGDLKRIDKKL